MFNKRPSMSKQLGDALSDNPVWRDLAETVSTVITEMMHEPRWALARIREAEVVQRGDWIETPSGIGQATYYRRTRSNIDTDRNTYDFQDFMEVQIPGGKEFLTIPMDVLHDRNTLVAQANNLGFDYFSYGIQNDDYQRIVTYVSKYWKSNGGEHFVDFMGFVKRMRFQIGQLYTEMIGDPGSPSIGTKPANDVDFYKNFLSDSEYLTKVWNRLDFDPKLGHDTYMANAFYPTSHVELGYDIFDHPIVDKLEILTLFYMLAPIHLVLERFNETVYVHIDLKAATVPMLYTIQQASVNFTIQDIMSAL